MFPEKIEIISENVDKLKLSIKKTEIISENASKLKLSTTKSIDNFRKSHFFEIGDMAITSAALHLVKSPECYIAGWVEAR